jgi:hypothetical protein
MLGKEHRRAMRITARFEEGSVESLVRIGVHSHDELVDVATTRNDRCGRCGRRSACRTQLMPRSCVSVVHALCLSAGLQPGYPIDWLSDHAQDHGRVEHQLRPGTRTVPCSESMSALAASQVAIWVAVHSGTAQFTRVHACDLSCGANPHEPR